MADWDKDSPKDTGIVSQFPGNERDARAAARTNFGVDHHETDDADIGKHETVQLLDQGGDPAAASGEGRAYAKVIDGTVELFYQDSDGNVVQMSKGGVIDVEGSLGYTPANKAGETFTGDLAQEKDDPEYEFNNTDGAADGKIWQFLASGTDFILRLANDARTLFTQILKVTRTGTTVDTINFPNGELQVGGETVRHDGNFAVISGTADHGDTIPLPTGFDAADTHTLLSIRSTPDYGESNSDDTLDFIECHMDSNRVLTCRSHSRGSGFHNGQAHYLVIGHS